MKGVVVRGVVGLFGAGCVVGPACAQGFFMGLGDLPGGQFASVAADVSADGSVVVGQGSSPNGLEAFLWTAGTGMFGLGDLPGGGFYSVAQGMSAEGFVVVGHSYSANGTEAFLWTPVTGMVGLGDLPGGQFASVATDVSADGSVVVGSGHSANGTEAFLWTPVTGMVGLGDLPGHIFESVAYGASADGSVVVGYSYSANGTEAFLWTAGTGMVGLGDLPGRQFYSSAADISGDGSVVVGQGHSENGWEAFIWDREGGIRSVREFLNYHHVTVPPGWQLRSATGVTRNGPLVTIVGWGVNPTDQTEAWLAVVDVRWRLVLPDAFTLFRGHLLGGQMEDLFYSDDSYMRLRTGITLMPVERPIQLIVEGQSPSTTPTEMSVVVEASAVIPNIRQWVEAYNFQTNSWTLLDMRIAPTSDFRLELPVPDPGQYVSASGRVRARISYKEAGVVLTYPWGVRIDELTWRVRE